MPASLSEQDRALLALLQDHFPLTAAPFCDLAQRLGWPEREVLDRVGTLKEHGLLRQIGAIFDTRRLGYASTLVALEVEPRRLEKVALAISQHPGVSHNYSREHTFNLWFTLAVPAGFDLAAEVQALADLPGVRRVLLLPAIRTFKISVRFDLGADELPETEEEEPVPAAPGSVLAATDVAYVRALQDDLPLARRPFAVLAGRYAVEESDLLGAARRFLEAGIMRRYGSTLQHRQAGYTANAMVCWQVDEECIAAAGKAAARQRAVSHCYQRPSYPPDWPYQLFTMIHCRSPEELARVVAELRGRILPRRMAVLPTVREFKKVRLRYFCEQ